MGNEVGALYISIGAKMDEALAAIAKIQTELKGVESSTKSAEDKFKKFADTCKNVGQQFKDFGKPLALAGAAITGAFAIAIKKTADLGDEFKDLAQRTGIAVETLSSFKLAADKSGTSVQGVATGMKGLSRVMYEAASGGKEAQEAFKAVGVSATDSSGKLRPLDQVMLDVADRFAGMADGAEKNALAMKLFGKAGMDLIPMLNLGRQGLQENIDKMQKYGVVTREEAEAGDAFNDAMTDLQAATGGLSRAIAGTLIPALTKFAEGAADIVAKVGAWAREHKGLTTVLAGGTFAIGATATAIGTLAYGIGTVIAQLPKLIAGFKAISAFAAKSIVFNFTLAGVAIVAAGVAKMIADFKKLREEGKTTADALAAMAPSFNPFKSMSREGLGKFLTDMDAARDKTINLKGAMILLGEAFKAIRGAIDAGVTGSVANLAAIFKDFGLKTKTELTEELGKAEAALKLLKTSAEATPGAIAALEDKIKTLKESLYGVRTETETLTETFAPLAKGAAFVRDVMQGFSGELTNSFLPAAREMSLVMAAAPASFDEASGAASAFNRVLTTLAKQMGITASEFRTKLWNIVSDVNACFGISMKKIGEVATVSYSVADQMAKAFGEAFATIIKDGLNFKNFFNSLLQGMVNTVATYVGGILTKKFKDFFASIKTDSASAFKSLADAAIAGAEAMIIAFGASVIIDMFTPISDAEQALFDQIDQDIEDAKKRGEELLRVITAAALSARHAALAPPATSETPQIGGASEGSLKAFKKIQDVINGIYHSSVAVDNAWSTLLGEAKRLGTEGSKALTDLIKAFRKTGKESKVLNEYMQSWLNTIPAALETLVAGIKKLGPSAKNARDDIGNLGRIALLTFNSMIASGMSWTDAVNAMAGPLSALRDKYKELGLESDPALAKLFRIVGITQKHKELFEAIDANRQILIALGNSAWLTADAFNTLTGQAVDQFQKLRHSGLSVSDSLRAMAPTLQAIVNYAAQYGFKIDAQTLSLINQAKKLGLIKDAQKDIGTVTTEGFKAVCLVLDKIVLALGDVVKAIKGINDQADDFTDEGERAGKRWKDAGDRARKAWDWQARDPGRDDTAEGRGLASFASGGIAWKPQLATVGELRPEIIGNLDDYLVGRPLAGIPAPSAGAGGRERPIIVNIKPIVIDKKDRYLIEFIQENFDHHVFHVPTAVVGG